MSSAHNLIPDEVKLRCSFCLKSIHEETVTCIICGAHYHSTCVLKISNVRVIGKKNLVECCSTNGDNNPKDKKDDKDKDMQIKVSLWLGVSGPDANESGQGVQKCDVTCKNNTFQPTLFKNTEVASSKHLPEIIGDNELGIYPPENEKEPVRTTDASQSTSINDLNLPKTLNVPENNDQLISRPQIEHLTKNIGINDFDSPRNINININIMSKTHLQSDSQTPPLRQLVTNVQENDLVLPQNIKKSVSRPESVSQVDQPRQKTDSIKEVPRLSFVRSLNKDIDGPETDLSQDVKEIDVDIQPQSTPESINQLEQPETIKDAPKLSSDSQTQPKQPRKLSDSVKYANEFEESVTQLEQPREKDDSIKDSLKLSIDSQSRKNIETKDSDLTPTFRKSKSESVSQPEESKLMGDAVKDVPQLSTEDVEENVKAKSRPESVSQLEQARKQSDSIKAVNKLSTDTHESISQLEQPRKMGDSIKDGSILNIERKSIKSIKETDSDMPQNFKENEAKSEPDSFPQVEQFRERSDSSKVIPTAGDEPMEHSKENEPPMEYILNRDDQIMKNIESSVSNLEQTGQEDVVHKKQSKEETKSTTNDVKIDELGVQTNVELSTSQMDQSHQEFNKTGDSPDNFESNDVGVQSTTKPEQSSQTEKSSDLIKKVSVSNNYDSPDLNLPETIDKTEIGVQSTTESESASQRDKSENIDESVDSDVRRIKDIDTTDLNSSERLVTNEIGIQSTTESKQISQEDKSRNIDESDEQSFAVDSDGQTVKDIEDLKSSKTSVSNEIGVQSTTEPELISQRDTSGNIDESDKQASTIENDGQRIKDTDTTDLNPPETSVRNEIGIQSASGLEQASSAEKSKSIDVQPTKMLPENFESNNVGIQSLTEQEEPHQISKSRENDEPIKDIDVTQNIEKNEIGIQSPTELEALSQTEQHTEPNEIGIQMTTEPLQQDGGEKEPFEDKIKEPSMTKIEAGVGQNFDKNEIGVQSTTDSRKESLPKHDTALNVSQPMEINEEGTINLPKKSITSDIAIQSTPKRESVSFLEPRPSKVSAKDSFTTTKSTQSIKSTLSIKRTPSIKSTDKNDFNLPQYKPEYYEPAEETDSETNSIDEPSTSSYQGKSQKSKAKESDKKCRMGTQTCPASPRIPYSFRDGVIMKHKEKILPIVVLIVIIYLLKGPSGC